MASLFESTNIKDLHIPNRFIRSATASGMADQYGHVTTKLTKHIMELVDGKVGLIITGHICIHPTGQTSPRQLCLYKDSQIPSLKTLVEKVHNKNGKVVAQINHGGAYADKTITQTTPFTSSVNIKTGPDCLPLEEEDILEMVSAYRDTALRVKEAGFNGVQLHGAHGYLLSQFLSPIYNERTDEYGGNVENRARFVVEIYEAIRKVVGQDYPVMIKMNVTDFLDEGISIEDALETAAIIDKVGFDAIELSGGVVWGWNNFGLDWSPCRTTSEEAYYLEFAKLLKSRVKTAIILTGGIRSYEVAEQLVGNGDADYVGLCRPLLREPSLVNGWMSGDTNPSLCIHDSSCLLCKGETICYQRK